MRLEIRKICNNTIAQSAAKIVIRAITLSPSNKLLVLILVKLKTIKPKAIRDNTVVKIFM